MLHQVVEQGCANSPSMLGLATRKVGVGLCPVGAVPLGVAIAASGLSTVS
jgi:hypothetical protein